MPIRVEHAPPAGMIALAGLMSGAGVSTEAQLSRSAAMAQTAARIGASRDMQVQQLGAQRDMQMTQIEAQADRQKEAADTAYARTALAAGLQEKIQEQQFDNELEKMQEGARIQASQFEYKYSAEQKREFAKYNNDMRAIEKTDLLSPEEKNIAKRKRQLDFFGGVGGPDVVPADPNKPKYPEGVGPGILTTQKNGSITTIDKDGIQKIILRPDQTMEYMERQEEIKQAQDKRDRQEALAKETRAARLKLLSERVTETDPASGAEIEVPRYRGPGVERLLREAGMLPSEEPTDEQLEQELQERVNIIKQAKVFLEEVEEKYGNDVKNIPPEMLSEIMRADEIIRRSGGG